MVDDDLREMNLWISKPIAITIPWRQFSTNEIRLLMQFHFRRLGYDVKSLHSEEVILDCTKKNSYKVILGVSSFQDNDIRSPTYRSHMLELLLHAGSANRRILVLEEPSGQLKEMAQRSSIEIWDRSQLESELCNSWLTQELVIDNSPLVKELMIISALLILAGEKGKGSTNLREVRMQNSPELKEIFWSLKDRAVTLQKNCMMLQYLCERTDIKKIFNRELFEANLNFLSTYGSRPILDLVRSNEQLLVLTKEVYKMTYGRSNWFHLASFAPSPLRPRRLEEAVTSKDFDWNSFESPVDAPEEMGQEVWRRLSIVTGALEATIDDMYYTWFGRPRTNRHPPKTKKSTLGLTTSRKTSEPYRISLEENQSRIEGLLSKIKHTRIKQTKGQSYEIFIVHGHDENSCLQLKAIIKEFGLHPIVLEEEPARGRTIIERLDQQNPGYAIILLTPDDNGKPRQNVIMEYGMFAGKLGRERICCLMKGKVEIPSNMQGITYISFRRDVYEIKDKIAKELEAAGYRIRKSA